MNAWITQRNLRILVIDDNHAIHDGFRKVLCSPQPDVDGLGNAEAVLFDSPAVSGERLSFEVDSAYQGEEGINMARAAIGKGRPHALAFVNVRMPPGCDGIEAASRLWQIDSDLEIVICTAYSDYSWAEMMAKLDHSDRLIILKKPFEPVEVLQLAATLTEKWALRQESRLRLDHLEKLVLDRTKVLQETNARLEGEIAGRKAAQAQREQLIVQLKEALARVQTLRGLIPICASCKKIRDDKGYWNQVETYVAEHSDAEFTHSICPACARRLYPDIEYPHGP